MRFISIPGQVTAVTVPAAAEPPEVAIPFHFDTTGEIAVVTDPAQRALQHILFVAMTNPGERVMRPTFGAGFRGLVFTNDIPGALQQAAADLQAAYDNADGDYSVVGISVTPSSQSPTGVVAVIQYRLDQTSQTHQAVFDSAGNLIGTS